MSINEVLAVEPGFSPIVENERARFYLENRELIETWAALRADAAEAIEERLPELADRVSIDLDLLDDREASVEVGVYRGCSTIEITRRPWISGEFGSPIRIVLESSERSLLDSQGNLRLYTAVRAKQSHPRASEFVPALARLRGDLRSALGSGWKSSEPRWPLWRYLVLDQESWSIDDVLRSARSDLLNLWVTAAPAIDALL